MSFLDTPDVIPLDTKHNTQITMFATGMTPIVTSLFGASNSKLDDY
jgi:hypothetical protein